MADHSELVSEMTLLEKMSTQDRLKLARKRRMQQLKKWNQKEKEYATKRKKSENQTVNGRKSSANPSKTHGVIKKNKKDINYKVHFVPSVMLLEAAARNDIEEVRRLLMLSVSPDSTNEDGLTALHQCCIDDSEEMMKLLIEFGANVNAKDSEQWTPLHAAATCGHLHLVKYLIAKGADLLAVNADGNMPYDICEDESTLDYIESEMASRGVTQEMIDETRAWTENQMLRDLKSSCEKSQDLEFRDSNGATPLHIASANGYLSVVEFLLDNHVSTDVVDNDLWQPVHAAACWGHPDVLELLVQAGADLEAKTKNGETPLDICEDPELKERITQLKSEMETKRNSSHSSRLKRSHSSNTRTQSVRRTSIREKSQISRREAKLEAKMRSQGVEAPTVTDTDTDTDGGGGIDTSRTSGGVMPDLLKSTSGSIVGGVDKSGGQVMFKSDRQTVNPGQSNNINNNNCTTKAKSVIDVNGSPSTATSDPQNSRSSSEKDAHQHHHHQRPNSTPKVSAADHDGSLPLISTSNTYMATTGSKGNGNQSTNNRHAVDSRMSEVTSGSNRAHKEKDNVIKNPGYSDRDHRNSNTNVIVNDDALGLNSSDSLSLKGNRRNVESSENVDGGDVRRSSSESAVKVEIHVTVNTGQSPTSSGHLPLIGGGQSAVTGTLADLKKLRTETRRGSESNRNSVVNGDVVDSPSGNNENDVGTTVNGGNNTTIRARYVVDTPTGTTSNSLPTTLQPPPSPSRPNIFRGDPSEVVGGNGGGYHKKGCCVIS